MGSSFKSNNSHGQRGNNINKPYAVTLLLVFGAAILGVMVLHKLREKRIFTLLVKQKDHELLTLHLLFQREKEFNQEARKKIEEMKNKAYSLRTQKLGLDRRVAELESTISALKDERKVIEIQMLTAAMNSSAGDPARVTALKSMMKMKDEEIEDLKLRLRKLDVRLETGENDGESQLNSDSFGDSTKGESQSQNDGSNQREGEHITDVEPNKLNDVKEASAIERENIGNEKRENQKEEGKSKVISGNGREEEQHKLRENGSTVRRKHSKGKRREVQRNRRLEDDLYSVSKTESTPALNIDEQQKFERNEGENKKETRNDGVYREEEVDKRGEETERKSAVNGTKAEHMDEHRKSMNVEGKLIHETKNQLNKQEKMQSNEASKHERENEHENEIANEESEDEDSEDAKTREPEIDREDIKRFSESDPDDEAEETEF